MRRRPGTVIGIGLTVGAVSALLGITAPGSQAASTLQPDRAASIAKAATRTATVVSGRKGKTKTPIKHVVVLFDENVSYDHYFGTYPKAANTDGIKFKANKHTPKNNNLISSGKLTSNPNQYPPFRLTPAEAATCDQNHAYGPEQQAVDGGLMDMFVQKVSKDTCTGLFGAPGLTMGYFDGNTVTGLWNYAQNFSMSDSFYDTTYGPSTPGALNLVSGQTHGFIEVNPTTLAQVPVPGSFVLASPDPTTGIGTVINDPDPAYDDCSDANHTSTNTLAAAKGKNIGDLLNSKGVTWGWFQGGFAPTTAASASPSGYAVCGATHPNITGASVVDYSPHHNPFSYYASTSNPHHLAPSSVKAVGHTDQANHQYDLTVFNQALKAGVMPSVSFLKAAEYQDGHAAYSDPIDEQHFLVNEINAIQKSKFWKSTAIVIAYDDSDGWYDHAFTAPKNSSHDALNDASVCSGSTAGFAGGYEDRCGPGPRLPLLVISPYAKADYVDHTATEQTSILKFIEDNWGTGRIGDFSFDQRAGSIKHMFDFKAPARDFSLILKPTGVVKKPKHHH